MSSEELSVAERRLLALCGDIHFGLIDGLQIHNGRPLLDRKMTIERIHKYADYPMKRKPTGQGFLLKEQQRNFITALRCVAGDQLLKLQIQHGMPFIGSLIETIN